MRAYGTLTQDERGWIVNAEPQVAMRLKRVMGKIDKHAAGPIRLSATLDTARDLAWFCERYPLDMAPLVRQALEHGATRHRDNIKRLEDLIDPSYTPPTFALKVQPRTYQAREAAIYLQKGSLLNADDVGLGKTASAICSFTDTRTLPAVFVTLTHLPKQMKDEIEKFAPELLVHIVRSGQPYELPKYMGHGPDVVIINYHKLAGWADVLSQYAKSIVFDEIQELRHNGSYRYQAVQHIIGHVPFRLGLSATPIYNYGGEIWNVFNVLTPGALGSFEEFGTEWCTAGGRAGEKSKIADPKAFGAYLREQFLMVRHTRKDVGRELPGVIKIPHRIDSDTEAIDRIRDTAGELARLILDNTTKHERGVKMHAYEEFSVLLRQATGIAKAPYVADFVRLLVEAGERVVLCGWHREVYAIWQSKLRDLNPVMYTGSESVQQKEASKQAFIRGDSPVMMLSLRSGAGMNGLQEVSSCIVFGELDYSPGPHEQCEGRLARDGQTSPVASYYLLADDGSDPIVAEMLGLKRGQIEGIRNPDAELFEKLDTANGEQLIKRLANDYLERRRHPRT